MCRFAERTGLKFDCRIIEHGATPVLVAVIEVASIIIYDLRRFRQRAGRVLVGHMIGGKYPPWVEDATGAVEKDRRRR